MTLDIPALTFNQWIMAGFIVFVSILLLGWVVLCIFSKKFRDQWMATGEDPVPVTREQYHDNTNREMYAIWVGRIVAFGPHLLGRHEKPIVRAQGVSVLIWMLAIICILGYVSGYYNRDFWLFFLGLVILGTYWYARWKASTILPETGD
ncbi:MAG: hypothetical protein LUQ35_05265 [Methanoregula sp.]|jgi:hypothetical protein|nr:hypothetical protein [Methanoregula sp.]